jgi:general secretion pathway protein D
MIFIRPTILRSKEDAQKLTQQRYGYVRGMQLQRNPDMEPTIDELVRDYMGATPPLPPQPGDAVVQPAAAAPAQVPAQVIEPTVRQSSGVVRPVDVAPSGGRK